MKKDQRNGMIELLRYLFCLGILFFHGIKYLFGEPPLRGVSLHFEPFIHGALGVEFFFIISGLFMAKSIKEELEKKKKLKNKDDDLPKEEFSFLKRKFMSIFPQHVFAYFFIFIVLVISTNATLKESLMILFNTIPNFLLINMTGITIRTINSIEWYISVMLIVMAILYPFAKKYYDNFVKIFCPIAALLLLGIIQRQFHSITYVMLWLGFCYKSTIRGFADIMLGMFLYEVAVSISKKNISKIKKIFLTIVELCSYLGCAMIIMFAFASKYEIYIIMFLAVGIPLTYSGITYTNKVNGKLFTYLGELTLPIYLIQLGTIQIVGCLFWKESHFFQLVMLYIITMVISIIALSVEKIIKSKIHKKNEVVRC